MTVLATATRMPDVGDMVAGRYRVDTVIGHGGMGVVYAATNRVTGKRVALKMLLPHIAHRPCMAERFVREARASARIAHRNVVDIHDVGDHEGSTFLVMELLTGMSLAEYLEEKRKLSLDETMAILAHVCRGVATAHAKGVIHRDLKPDNIFLRVDEHGEPLDLKVVDFGISKLVDAELQANTATGTGQTMGTPFYMPPEQMTGAREVTKTADIYSLGVVIFRCLTGEYPHVAENLATLAIKQHSEPPRELVSVRPEFGTELSLALARALAHRPEDRYPSVEAMVEAFAPFGLARVDAPLPRFEPPARISIVRRLDEDVASGPTALAEQTPSGSSSGMRAVRGSSAPVEGATTPSWRLHPGARVAIGLVVVAAIVGGSVWRSRGITTSAEASPGGAHGSSRDETASAPASPDSPRATDRADTAAVESANSAVELEVTSAPNGAQVEAFVFAPGAAADAPPTTISLGATPTQMVLLASEMPLGARLELRFTLPDRAPVTVSRSVDRARIAVHADLTAAPTPSPPSE